MKKQLVATCGLALLVLASAPSWAANGNIGLFFDQAGAVCQQAVPCGGQARLYVYALLEGASQFGITGAEYKVQVGPNSNPDPGWLFNETFDPNAATIGSGAFNPVDNSARGINVSWAECQTGDGYKVLIETVDIFNATSPCNTDELALKVVKHDTASNQFFQCPLFVLCDAPVYTKVCLGSNIVACRNPEPPNADNAFCSTSGEAFVNGSRNCTVAVQPTSWSAMKDLYRN